MNEGAGPLLSVRGLSVEFGGAEGSVRVVDGVSLEVGAGETVALVGESGSGKSVTALAVMGLLPRGAGRIVEGRVEFEGMDLLAIGQEERRRIRGRRMAMIFQEPMTALNPLMTIRAQVSEALEAGDNVGRRTRATDRRREVVDLLERVGIADAERRAGDYPHQMSGGMRQRVLIAMALACRPALLIADEPTTALDVTIQAQVLELLRGLQREHGMSMLLITHDLGVVSGMAERVVVMYAGRVVEEGKTEAILERPLHPYTRGLLECVPRLERMEGRLKVIEGSVPEPGRWPEGCRYHPRCSLGRGEARCRAEAPAFRDFAGGRRAACWKVEE